MYVVTGGGSGIGRALAMTLAAREQSVLIIGRREQLLIETAAQSPLIDYLSADVSTDEGRDVIVNHLASRPNIKGLINNAGTIHPIAAVQALSPMAWQQAMATNVDAPMFLTQRLYPQLSNGRVLNIGSAVAHFPVKSWAAYCVSKAALAMLTRCFALESETVAFASVMPGIIDTDMQTIIRGAPAMKPEERDFYKTLKARNTLLQPEVVAAFLCWLLLDLDKESYTSKEWDIYDQSHHASWLKPPMDVPPLETE